ncbi:MAG: DUF2285 domain-containing protein [Hyphomicrobiales bacterium]|nr:MAG: DUF2285 domain-containing protein [Hyphomicrobiales bacterium]
MGADGTETFAIDALTCGVSIFRTVDGWQHVLIEDHRRSLRLAVCGSDLLGPVQLKSNALWPPSEIRQRLNRLECLNALRSTGRLPPRFFPVEPRRARLRSVLRALDGSISGASHREIGTALFGKARMERDWTDPGDHLRDIVRRAVRRGHALMTGGYRRFLQ